jgi:hypothetical protein
VTEMYRQGDLLFIRVNDIPEDATVKASGVIAEGEVTGHTHAIAHPGVDAVLKIAAGIAYIQAMQDVTPIVHQEHNTIELPAGNWVVHRQREYTPEGYRTVQD